MTATDRLWLKSSHSSAEHSACVEYSCDWVRSSHSNPGQADCVEIAAHPSAIHIRDSKTPEAPYLTITPTTWSAFLATASSPLR